MQTVSLIIFLDGGLSARYIFSSYSIFTFVVKYFLCKGDAWMTQDRKVI